MPTRLQPGLSLGASLSTMHRMNRWHHLVVVNNQVLAVSMACLGLKRFWSQKPLWAALRYDGRAATDERHVFVTDDPFCFFAIFRPQAGASARQRVLAIKR